MVSQIAISLLMLMAAGLFVRTLSNLQSIELGFNRENLLPGDDKPDPGAKRAAIARKTETAPATK